MAHLDDLVDVLNGYFRKKTSDVWLDELDVAGVPAGPILSIGEMLEHPQALARDMIVETEQAARCYQGSWNGCEVPWR